MIASLLSYEAERLAIGRLGGDYFAKNRSPQGRLTFKLDAGRAASMTLLSLVYPNKTLAGLYNPIEYLNAGIRSSDGSESVIVTLLLSSAYSR